MTKTLEGPAYRSLDPARIPEVEKWAKVGSVNGDLAVFLGVHVATFQRYLAHGRAEHLARLAGQPPDTTRDHVCDLYERVTLARATLHGQMNAVMVRAANNGDWRAANAINTRDPAYASGTAGGPALGGESADDAADLAETQVTAVQARQVAQAMLSLIDDLVALARAEGIDAVEARARDLARAALLGVDSEGPPVLGA
jgi:hypothetical protein